MEPPWLNRDAYPFASHFLSLDAGRLHYVDEGAGAPVLMLHGNPTWSFLYRHLIAHLAPDYRCVAPDYLGFGLSDKPAEWSYHPSDHAQTVEALVEALALDDLTLVVHDWGGPLGLSYALRHPERVRRLVIMNTWLWPLTRDLKAAAFSALMGRPPGRFLIRRFNLFARWIMPLVFGDRSRLTPEAHRHYLKPAARPTDRTGHWVFARALLDATTWLESLWARRDALTGTPALLLWGMRDPAFGNQLARWTTLLPTARVERLADVGHYVPEEMGSALEPRVAAFLQE